LGSASCRYLELETTEFVMGTVMDAVVSQGMITSREKGLQLIRETPREIKSVCLFGDQVRLQQVLADFLLNAVRFTPSSEGWVGIKVVPTKKRLGGGIHVVHLEFRFARFSLLVATCGSMVGCCAALEVLSTVSQSVCCVQALGMAWTRTF
jgi:signal transduction histidine kinase